MNKKIIAGFLRDKLPYTVGFIANSFFLIAFFSLSAKRTVEIVYPLIISAFVLSIVIIIEWIRYYRFNSNLQMSINNVSFELNPNTAEQEQTARVISSIHTKYINEISEISIENKNSRHFISQWVHNMKTPVSVIDLIIQKYSAEAVIPKGALTAVGEENERLRSILDQVLNIMRLEEFSKDYIPESTDLAASVKKVINGKKNQFIYSKVFPHFEYKGENAFVLSDSKWNELMLEQIVSNAIKYSAPTELSKNVFFTIEQKGVSTFLTIRDEGIGIPSYDLPRIFEPFFTGEKGRKYKNATGIGLYICSVIASKLSHSISIESEQGKGTSVIIKYLSKL